MRLHLLHLRKFLGLHLLALSMSNSRTVSITNGELEPSVKANVSRLALNVDTGNSSFSALLITYYSWKYRYL